MSTSASCLCRWPTFLALLLTLAGSANAQTALPPAQLWQIAREVPGADPRWQRIEADRTAVRVWRGGREIAVQRLMVLAAGRRVRDGSERSRGTSLSRCRRDVDT